MSQGKWIIGGGIIRKIGVEGVVCGGPVEGGSQYLPGEGNYAANGCWGGFQGGVM